MPNISNRSRQLKITSLRFLTKIDNENDDSQFNPNRLSNRIVTLANVSKQNTHNITTDHIAIASSKRAHTHIAVKNRRIAMQ